MVKSRRERRLERLQKKSMLSFSESKKPESSTQSDISMKSKKKGNFFSRIYEDHYKKLVLIPMLLLLLSFVVIGFNIAETGDFMNKAVSLKGGITLTIPTITQEIDFKALESNLKSDLSKGDLSVRELSEFGVQKGVIIEASGVEEDELLASTKKAVGDFGDSYSLENLGPSLGASFFKQMMFAVILAFIFMGIVVFLYFKTFVPSVAVMLAAFSNIVIALAVTDLLGMKISAAGIAAFLMLIGYSVDTDILLTTRVLKRKEGTLMERIYGAMKTGLTMNITTIVAVTIALIVTNSDVIAQIMTIILIGLMADIVNTWIQNVAILRYYLEKKGIKE